VLSLALDGTARGQTDGLSADGATLGATLEEGQNARFEKLPLDVGSCVTFVAQGGLGVIEVDLFLLTEGSPSPRILAQDAESGPSAVIGGRRGCFPVDHALQADLVVLARKGSGSILVQRYRR